VVEELTQVLSPIEEEEFVTQERDPIVRALCPSESEEDYSGSQQSIQQKVGSRTNVYVI
jgi:hypothetical protein